MPVRIGRQFKGTTRGGRRVTREDQTQGAQDLSLGFKYKLVEQDGWIPHFGVIGAITVPSGSTGVSSGDVDPESNHPALPLGDEYT